METFSLPTLELASPAQTFATWKDVFSAEELGRVRQAAEMQNTAVATVGEASNPANTEIRDTKVGWIRPSEASMWIYHRLNRIASIMNADYFHLDLRQIAEALQVGLYEAPGEGAAGDKGGHYDWHMDFSPRQNAGAANVVYSRKLSVVLQLSDPSEYDGGNLEVWTGGDVNVVPKALGMMSAFPSYVMHRVTPVTRGRRITLVAWFSGPQFR